MNGNMERLKNYGKKVLEKCNGKKKRVKRFGLTATGEKQG